MKEVLIMAKVVKYNGKIYLWYKTNNAGFAQLINEHGIKFTGTPNPAKLEVLKELPCVEFNGHNYVITKQGVYSCTTGDKVTHPEILRIAGKKLAEIERDKTYYCTVCHKNIVDAVNGFDTCPECVTRV
jgi:hypothetical protein